MKQSLPGLGAPTLENQPKPDVAEKGTPARRFSFNAPSLKAATAMLPSLSMPFSGSRESLQHPGGSVAALSHRENTPLHALRDTFNVHAPSMHLPLIQKAAAEEDGLGSLTGPVVLLGGYRGSVLRDAKTNRRIWAPVKAAFRLRTADLEMGLTDEAEERSTETVIAEKMLTTVGGFVQMGKNLKERLVALEKEGKITFRSFGYDWRRNLDLSSAELLSHVEAAYAETGQGATIIAHSMGGLVALHALAKAKDPHVFARLLFVGTPFQGCQNALGPLRHGDTLGWNAEICSPKAVFSMRSTFYFLPPGKANIFEKEDGTPIPTDFFSPDDWSHFGFSPVTLDLHNPASATRELALRDAETASFVDENASIYEDAVDDPEAGTLPIAPSMSSSSRPSSAISPRLPQLETKVSPRDDRLIADYLKRTLGRVKRFREEIIDGYDPAKADSYPPLGLLVSSSTPTVSKSRVSTEADVIAGDFSRLIYDHGDGIVLHSSATQLPGDWGKHVVCTETSTYGHVSLLSDLPAVRRCFVRL